MEGSYGHIAIGEADKAHLRRAANWAKFIAIVQFIAIGFGLVFCLLALLGAGIAGASMLGMGGLEALPAGFMTVYLIFLMVLLAVSFFLALFLLRFASNTLRAVNEGNDSVMTEAFANLGNYFLLTGVMMIVTMATAIAMPIIILIFTL